MSKKYKQLDRPIKEISANELRQSLGHLKKSELMRTIILNEKEFLSIDYERSLRGFWYSTVKPTLEKLGLLTEQDQTEDALTKWDAELSRYTAELVKAGVLTYKDLRIVDQSRQRENPQNRYNTTDIDTFCFKTNVPAYSNIIISTEKDTIYSIISGIARLFGCSCISGKGQNSLGAMESLLRGMNTTEKDIYILTMTDYDPSGYYIADTFRNQVTDLRAGLHLQGQVHIERVGIFPGQLKTEEIENNKYTPKPTNLEKWFKLTGGINGEPKGLELDALTPARIRQIFVTCLKNYIDETVYKTFIKQAYIKCKILTSIQEQINIISQDITDIELDNITLKDFDIYDLAVNGYDRLPVENLCNNDRDLSIQELAISHFI